MLGEKIVNKINGFVDQRFNTYREQISDDVAEGVSTMAGMITVWTMSLLSTIFIGIAGGFALSSWSGSYLIGFSIIAGLIFIISVIIVSFRKTLIVDPVYKAINSAFQAKLPAAKEAGLVERIEKVIEEQAGQH